MAASAVTSTTTAPAEARRPLVTIALPTYNRAQYLDRFFTHHIQAFEARGIDFEILVSDNRSTDDTPAIVSRWAKADPRIRSVRQSENIGAYGNFLYTWRQSRGEFAIWVGDDDLLVPDVVIAYLGRLAADPDLVMVQAPWMLIDETRDNAEMGTFYRIAGERLFRQGEHQACLDYMLDHHIFPEWFIIRTSVVHDVIEPVTPYAFHYFAHLARALTVGSVLFAPEPFARVTAISKGGVNHTGNSETMDGWDRFRGGVEFFASFIEPAPLADPVASAPLLRRFQNFTIKRMQVAINLHIHAGNWSHAYHLDRRVRAYGQPGCHPDMRPVVAGLCALETLVAEAKAQARHLVVLDDMIADDTLESLQPKVREAFIRRRDPRAAAATPKAFALMSPPPANLVGPDDIVLDLHAAFRRAPA
jgi:glycosyltransferase involved in cell wall biosynthesis